MSAACPCAFASAIAPDNAEIVAELFRFAHTVEHHL
jgi:hypothetical protein